MWEMRTALRMWTKPPRTSPSARSRSRRTTRASCGSCSTASRCSNRAARSGLVAGRPLTPPTEEAMKYDLEVLKKLGFNMVRKHIKVEPARLVLPLRQARPARVAGHAQRRHPDREAVIPPNAKRTPKFTDEDKKQFRDGTEGDDRPPALFPCIVVWVPFNEGWGQHDTNDILKWMKEYDPTRLVNGPSGWADRGVGDMKDMHNYPGPGMFPVDAGPRQRARRVRRPRPAAEGPPLEGHRQLGLSHLQDDRGTARRITPAHAPAAPADRQGALRRGLHADHRRRSGSERPDDLRPRGASSSMWRRRRSGTRHSSARRRSTANWCPRPRRSAQKWRYTTDEARRRVGEARLRRGEVEGRRRRLRHEGHAGHGRRAPSGRRDGHLDSPRRSS